MLMTAEIPVHRLLSVVRDFEAAGGASPGLVAWELSVEETAIRLSCARAAADGLLEPAGIDRQEQEELWRLTPRGWTELGISPTADRRRREAVSRLGILDRVGDPALTALTRIASYIAGGSPAAIHIFDERYQLRVAAAYAPLADHPAHETMCRLVVDQEQPVVSADASVDPRFSYSSLVRGPEPVLFYAAVPLRTVEDGTVIGALCAFDRVPREFGDEQMDLLEDLARQAVSQIEFARQAIDLGQLAMHDPLTGAVNRLLLHDRLAQAFARRRRHGGEVAVMMVDIDDFKALNDTYGHAAGDAVLGAVARRLTDSVRVEDTIARIGGDEFAVLTELVAGEDVDELRARIRARLAEPVRIDGIRVELRVSLGVVIARPRRGARGARPGRRDDVREQARIPVGPAIIRG